jgi:uncharacterized membrane protein HdeD (DUF308 family)
MNEMASSANSEMFRSSTTAVDLVDLQPKWNWCTKLGVVLIILGILAIGLLAFSKMDPVPWLSWLIVLSGMAESVHAFHLRKSGAFFFHLVPGVAGVPLGVLVATHPDVGLVTWMLVFACFFTVIGLFRLVSAVRLRFPAWPWAAFDSVAMLGLGCAFWTTSPRLGLWFFDVAVGASLILRGWSSVMFGFGLRHWQAPKRMHLSRSHGPRSNPNTSTQALGRRVSGL